MNTKGEDNSFDAITDVMLLLKPFIKSEQEVFDAIIDVMVKIQDMDQRGRLKCNNDELLKAIHVLQQFPIQHMLHRIWPKEFSDWYIQ